ncbi:MAG: hypothetical protein JWM56_568 [Candidatus Peribacteria bacterium]|nr:hypothetical protein [Candidatus Peribacteria bacterium]
MIKILPLKQIDDSDCGPTSIKMAVDYLGLPISFKEIARVSEYKRKDGLTDIDLVHTIKKLGLRVRAKRNTSWTDLRRANKENAVIIVSWMKYGYMGHFSVVDSVQKDHILLADPEFGTLEKIEKLIFMRLWMDYDDVWYAKQNTDIQLRWMAVVSKKKENGSMTA